MRRFEASPEIYAGVAAILAQHETEVYPPDPAPHAGDETDAPADPESSSPAAIMPCPVAAHPLFAAPPEADGLAETGDVGPC